MEKSFTSFPTGTTSEAKIRMVGDKVTNLLILKNRAYGDSALNPTKVFSKLDATQALCSRIDDKLNRIKNKGLGDETEDTLMDLVGYLILLIIARDNQVDTDVQRCAVHEEHFNEL